MKLFKNKVPMTILVIGLIFGLASIVRASHPTVDLGTAENFAVLAGSTITDANPSVVTGDVGLSPASGSFIDITCAEVDGDIYAVDAAGPAPCAIEDLSLVGDAKSDLTTAYNEAAGRSATTIGTELGGETLTDGTYDSASTTFEIVAGGTLTLDGEGNEDAVFIFQMGTTLVTFANSNVVLINGAQACNVFWQVGSAATLGTGTDFVGTVMADQTITDNGGSTVEGRLLARIAAVNLDDTTINVSVCATEDEEEDEDEDEDEDDTPGLPGAGLAPKDMSSTWYLIIPAGISIALFSYYVARKKRA